MQPDLERILKIEVPVIVRLGERQMTLGEVLALVPGMIIELPMHADDELSLLVNNMVVGQGTAVKVGENFGICISHIGAVEERVEAMGPDSGESDADAEAAALAEAMLAGQL